MLNMIVNEGIGDILSLADLLFKMSAEAKQNASGANNKSYSYSSISKAASNLIAVFPVMCSTNVSKDTASLCVKNAERQGCVGLQLVLSAVNLNDAKNGFEYLSRFHQNIRAGGATLDDFEIAMGRWLRAQQNESFYLDKARGDKLMALLRECTNCYYEDTYSNMSLSDYIVNETSSGYMVSIHEANSKDKPFAKSISGNSDTPLLRDSDAKKVNEAVPSLLVVRFTTPGANGAGNIQTEFLIGVKAKLIPVDYTEILNKIYLNNKDGQGLANIVRWTSGEIKFFRDFLFSIDRARDDIISMKNGSKEPIWKTLEYRAQKSKYLIKRGMNNDASAITTVVITSEDADLLYKEENVNVKDPKIAKRFMDSYNLYSFVIVNEAEEVAWFMYDNYEPYFDKIAFDMLERETSDTQYKKIVNLMSKMR